MRINSRRASSSANDSFLSCCDVKISALTLWASVWKRRKMWLSVSCVLSIRFCVDETCAVAGGWGFLCAVMKLRLADWWVSLMRKKSLVLVKKKWCKAFQYSSRSVRLVNSCLKYYNQITHAVFFLLPQTSSRKPRFLVQSPRSSVFS